jgi:hypothetical protein
MTRSGRAVVVLVSFVLLGGAARAESPAEEPAAAYRSEWHPNAALIIVGSAAFGVSWAISTAGGYALTDAHQDHRILAVPVAGPWITAAEVFRDNGNSVIPAVGFLMGVFLVLDGIVELGAPAVAIAGLATRRRVRVTGPPVTVVPFGGPAGGGLAAMGRF